LEGVKHMRSLFYVWGEFWVLVYNLETESPVKMETLWHWHPSCEVQKETGGINSSINERGNLKIIPVGKPDWNVDFVEGHEKPEIQGWYSNQYSKYEPKLANIFST